MIKSVTITNDLGESIVLELRFPEKSGFLVREGGIGGLGPAKATINTTESSTIDGAKLNSAHVGARNIVFDLGFIGMPTIEDTRQKSYKYFPIGKSIKIQIETDNRICQTVGSVESNEPDIFSEQEGANISVICPDAYFYSTGKDIATFSTIQPLFEFPFSNESLSSKLLEFGSITISTQKSISYSGDAPVGVIMFIHATGPVRNLTIYNVKTRGIMRIDSNKIISLVGSDIRAGDNIIISTVKGDKYIYLERDGVFINIFNALGMDVGWIQLEKGDNPIAYTADGETTNIIFRLENQIAYEGI